MDPSWRLLRLCGCCPALRGAARRGAQVASLDLPVSTASGRSARPRSCAWIPSPHHAGTMPPHPTTPPAAAVWWAELARSPSAGDRDCVALPAVEDDSRGGGAFPATRPWIYLGSPRLPAPEQWPPPPTPEQCSDGACPSCPLLRLRRPVGAGGRDRPVTSASSRSSRPGPYPAEIRAAPLPSPLPPLPPFLLRPASLLVFFIRPLFFACSAV